MPLLSLVERFFESSCLQFSLFLKTATSLLTIPVKRHVSVSWSFPRKSLQGLTFVVDDDDVFEVTIWSYRFSFYPDWQNGLLVEAQQHSSWYEVCDYNFFYLTVWLTSRRTIPFFSDRGRIQSLSYQPLWDVSHRHQRSITFESVQSSWKSNSRLSILMPILILFSPARTYRILESLLVDQFLR